jgi:hypothetical protein
MKKILLFIAFIISFYPSNVLFGQTKKASGKDLPGMFAKLKYDKVIAYDFHGAFIVSHGKLYDSIEIVKQITLSKQQIDTLHSFLFNTNTYGCLTNKNAGKPRLGIVYYLDNKIVAHISISLLANFLISNFEIPATSYERIKLPKSNYYTPGEGFSKMGRQKINNFCKELKFTSYQEALNSKFDK